DDARSIEIACNRFTAEFLAPEDDMPWHLFRGQVDLVSAVGQVADRYSVSREVILRRLLDRGIVDSDTYRHFTERWTQEYIEGRADRSGGNYYATQAAYLGDRFLDLAFAQYRAGK